MSNGAILGGSPLGLIGVKSFYGPGNLSTFNAGKTRNVNVVEYNKNSSSAGGIYGNSLFSGYRLFRAWPDVASINSTAKDPTGVSDVEYGTRDNAGKDKSISQAKKNALHTDSIYDTSILNIIEKLSPTQAALRPADFVYLKNIGVYPNNRLIIARRFGAPVGDNIMVNKGKSILPFATLISWIPESEDFLNITFGEEWMDSEADFKGILNSLGEDIKIPNLGGIMGAAGNALPLPGFTEIFQRKFLAKLGIIEDDKADSIPAGNPNLIKMAKRRKTIGYTEPGSGLKCTVNIKMVCEYELKYISGIDPTIVWMDILGMITRFGTSNSDTYGLSKEAASKVKQWANDPNLLIQDAASKIKSALNEVVTQITTEIGKAYDAAKDAAKKVGSNTDTETTKTPTLLEKAEAERANRLSMVNILQKAINAAQDVLVSLVHKYRVKFIGVINALTGLPSTPWHITIGNPLRPVFCSGDMLVENVSLKLGPILAFNDLPSSITAEFNITNARPWGLQEIMAKFNSGYLRTVDVQKTFYETRSIASGDGKSAMPEQMGILPLNKIGSEISGSSGTSGSSGVSGNNSINNNTTPVSGSPAFISPLAQPSNLLDTQSFLGNPPDNLTSVTKTENGRIPNVADMKKDASSSTYGKPLREVVIKGKKIQSSGKLTAEQVNNLPVADREKYLQSLSLQEKIALGFR